jgi:hypothetical protein
MRGMRILVESKTEGDHQEDQDVCGKIRKFLSSCATGNFSRRAQLHGVSYNLDSLNGPFNISHYMMSYDMMVSEN